MGPRQLAKNPRVNEFQPAIQEFGVTMSILWPGRSLGVNAVALTLTAALFRVVFLCRRRPAYPGHAHTRLHVRGAHALRGFGSWR